MLRSELLKSVPRCVDFDLYPHHPTHDICSGDSVCCVVGDHSTALCCIVKRLFQSVVMILPDGLMGHPLGAGHRLGLFMGALMVPLGAWAGRPYQVATLSLCRLDVAHCTHLYGSVNN